MASPPHPIKIEIKPPPPHYDEATKQLETNKLVKTTSGTPVVKNHAKSQVMTDVLEILIRNGELPETAAFDPSTPTTPSLSSISTNAPTLTLFTTASTSVPSTTTTLAPTKISTPPPTTVMARPASPPSKLTLNLLPSLDNVEMLSPMQPDCDNSVSSFDMFLEQQEQQHLHAEDNDDESHLKQNDDDDQHYHSNHEDNKQELHDRLHDQMLQQQQQHDDLELMELMGQQLDMDMTDEPQFALTNHVRYMNTGICDNSDSKLNRRDPSLQPSLNEIIMQQQQQQQQQSSGLFSFGLFNGSNGSVNSSSLNNNNTSSANNNNNNNQSNANNNNHYPSIPMDIEDFENSLSSFDFSQITGVTDDHQINTPPHPFSSQAQQHHQQQHHIMNPMALSSLHHHNFVETSSSDSSYDPPLALNHENILDLFNIDDFKMSNDTLNWGEVDFAV